MRKLNFRSYGLFIIIAFLLLINSSTVSADCTSFTCTSTLPVTEEVRIGNDVYTKTTIVTPRECVLGTCVEYPEQTSTELVTECTQGC